MPRVYEFISGAELIWVIWLVLIPVWTIFTIKLFQQCRLRNPLHVWREEAGLSYTLAFVLTVPLYLMICSLFFEVTLLLLAKLGTMYAAYAGARSAVVWESISPASLRSVRVRQAVVSALAPFAIQARNPGSPVGVSSDEDQQFADDYVIALEQFSETVIRREKIRQHVLDVAGKTSVSIDISRYRAGADVIVTVEFRATFLTPVIARLLDPDQTFPYEYPIKSRTTLNLERPVSEDGRLGIDYRAF